MRTKHQLNLAPNPEGTQKNLDDRRYGGREEQRIPRVGGSAGAAQGVPDYLRALGDRTGRTVANDGESVPEVLTPAWHREWETNPKLQGRDPLHPRPPALRFFATPCPHSSHRACLRPRTNEN